MGGAALARAAEVIRQGGLVAYPTEAVYGLGCDPRRQETVVRLLRVKQRPASKGLILIAADIEQLRPYLGTLDQAAEQRVRASWPGPVTWLWPARVGVPQWLRGTHDTLAVRVTAHPLAAALCRAAGTALVSTSANRAGEAPARGAQEVIERLGGEVDYVLQGPVGQRERPSEIRDARSGQTIRPG